MKTPEEYFNMGAEAMRSKLVAMAVIENQIFLAQKMLITDIPKFEEPEKFKIEA